MDEEYALWLRQSFAVTSDAMQQVVVPLPLRSVRAEMKKISAQPTATMSAQAPMPQIKPDSGAPLAVRSAVEADPGEQLTALVGRRGRPRQLGPTVNSEKRKAGWRKLRQKKKDEVSDAWWQAAVACCKCGRM